LTTSSYEPANQNAIRDRSAVLLATLTLTPCHLEVITPVKRDDAMNIICTLPEGELRQRRIEIQALFSRRRELTRHPDGLELAWPFSEEIARSLLDFILFERGCCQSFSYELRSSPPHDILHLRLRASFEQVEALQALYC
jgi:hypothetical protein